MSEFTFTKGSWAVNPVNAQVDAFDGASPLPVCQLLWPTDIRSEEETFANAILIAAAPDLYEALSDIVGTYEALSSKGIVIPMHLDDDIRIARQILAAARGES